MHSHAFIYCVILAVPILALIARKFYITETSRMTSQTPGRVVMVEQRAVSDAVERRTETEVEVTYTIAGTEYQIKRIFPGERAVQFPIGRVISVRYNPATPTMAQLVLN